MNSLNEILWHSWKNLILLLLHLNHGIYLYPEVMLSNKVDTSYMWLLTNKLNEKFSSVVILATFEVLNSHM